ncbi:MAG: hypothetical protein WCX77_04320 [Candidatus Paceibacterota bacterium]|jgi:hypothetical protein
MKKPTISKNKKRKLRDIPYILAEKAFWIFILLFSSSAFFIFVFLYQPIKNQKEILNSAEDVPAQFDEETLQQILEQWKMKKNKVESIEQKKYPDIFSKKDSSYQNESSASSSASSTFSSSPSQTSTASATVTTTTMATTSNP